MRPLVLALLFASAVSAQEVRRERFLEGTTSVEGRIQEVILEDLDADGRRDMIITHTAFPRDGKQGPRRYVSVKWQRGGTPMEGRPDQTWLLPPQACVLIFGNYTEAPGYEMGFLAADGAWVWEQKDRKFSLEAKRLLMAETFFDLPQDDSFPMWWWALDVDGNGLSEVLLPQADSYRLYVQTKPGVYGRAMSLEMKTVSKAEEGGAAFVRVVKSLPRVELQDVNGDFRLDVCFIVKDQFVYFLQGTEKSDGTEALTFPRQPSGQFQLRFLLQKEKKDQIATAITYLSDLNRGGGVDFVASYTAGDLSNIGAIYTDYYMYLGNGGRPIDTLQPNWRIRLPGISYNPQIGDVNGDGFADVAVSSFETSTLSNAGKVVFQKVPVDYYIYLFDTQKQSFPAEYDHKETVYVDIDKMNAGGGMPQVWFTGDFDGDGRKDALRLDSEGWLACAPGIVPKALLRSARIDFDKTDLFRFRVSEVDNEGKADFPKVVQVWEVNSDGKADVLLRWSSRVKLFTSK